MKKLIAITLFLLTAVASAKGYSNRAATFDVTFTVIGQCSIDGRANGGSIECLAKVPYLVQHAGSVQSADGKASLLDDDTIYF